MAKKKKTKRKVGVRKKYKTMRIDIKTHTQLNSLKKELRCEFFSEVLDKLASGKILYAVESLEGSKLLPDLLVARGEAIQYAASTGSTEVSWPAIYMEMGIDNGK